MSIPIKNGVGALAVTVGLAAVPFFGTSDYWLGVLVVCFIYAIWAASLDFMSGLTGRMNFGHTVFIGAAAYTSAFLDSKFGLGMWQGMLSAIVIAVLFGFIVGLPTLRLDGPYFVLAMLTASTIMQRLTRIFWEHTGGEDGIPGLAPLTSSLVSTYYLCFGTMIVTVVTLLVLARSHWGLLLRGIRGDELALEAAGINVTFYKMFALIVSAIFAGIGGVLHAHFQGTVTPELFGIPLAFTIVMMVYFGGLGSIYGAAGAAILLALLPEMMRELGQFRLLIYATIIILIAYFAPNGLIAPIWRRVTRAS